MDMISAAMASDAHAAADRARQADITTSAALDRLLHLLCNKGVITEEERIKVVRGG